MRSSDAAHEASILQRIQSEWKAYAELGLCELGERGLTRVQSGFFERGVRALVDAEGRIRAEALRRFREHRYLVGDNPRAGRRWLRFVDGRRRGEEAVLRECQRRLCAAGYERWLHRYPCSPVGHPRVFETAGCRFTHRWYRHIHHLGRFLDHLGERLPGPFVGVDIGSSYGIFASLLHQERPGCHWILVDFPEQLVQARYFLSMSFPEARIAGVEDWTPGQPISRELVEAHDFVLLPCTLYETLMGGAADLVTSFACLGELARGWFERYLGAPVFREARYFFTVNPVAGAPTFETDVTILDYPIGDPAKRLHFGVSPAYFHSFAYPKARAGVLYELRPFLPFFEYIGVI